MWRPLSYLLGSAALANASIEVNQVHLGLLNGEVGCENGISISFASNSETPLQVHYQSDKECSNQASTTSVDSYTVKSDGYQYSSPYLHNAKLCDLKPLATYTYKIDGFNSTFRLPPKVGSRDVPTMFSVVGDIGLESIEQTLGNMATSIDSKSQTQAIFIVGDIAYGNGEHEIWDEWYTKAQNILSKIPSLGINGNHETIKGGGDDKDPNIGPENYLGYIKRVGPTTPATPSNLAALRTYYSIDVGLVHCVFLDDYVGHRGDKQVVGTPEWLEERNLELEWLKADLRAVDREATPWLMVFKHNPYYNTWDDHQCKCSPKRFEIDDAESCWNGVYDKTSEDKSSKQPHCGIQAKFEDVYLEHGVDVVVAGHIHAYERTAPIKKNKIDSTNGVVYITTGAGGHSYADERLGEDEIPDWSIHAIKEIAGGLRVIATADTLKAGWFANSETAPRDTFDLIKA